MSMAAVLMMKEFRAEIRAEITALKERVEHLTHELIDVQNKYKALNARMGKKDG